MERQTRAYLFGLAAVLLWSTVASAFKLSLRHLSVDALVAWASLVSALALTALAGIRGVPMLSGWKQWKPSLFQGAINPFLYYLVLLRAYDLLPAQEAQAINYTWAITMTFMAIFWLGQRVGWRQMLASLVCYFGVVIIATRGDLLGLHFQSPLGVGLALASTLIWGTSWILGLRDTAEPVARLCGNFICGAVYAFAWLGLRGQWAIPSAAGMLGAAYVGCFEMGITFALWSHALRLSRTAAQINNLIYLSPLLSLFWIGHIVGETIRPSTLAGLACILVGTAIQRLSDRHLKSTEHHA
jgi:drug/metabolite transporter (DMT)-like permease